MSYFLFISHNILLSSRCNDSNHASFSSLILRYALPFGLHQDIYKLYSLSLFLIIPLITSFCSWYYSIHKLRNYLSVYTMFRKIHFLQKKILYFPFRAFTTAVRFNTRLKSSSLLNKFFPIPFYFRFILQIIRF